MTEDLDFHDLICLMSYGNLWPDLSAAELKEKVQSVFSSNSIEYHQNYTYEQIKVNVATDLLKSNAKDLINNKFTLALIIEYLKATNNFSAFDLLKLRFNREYYFDSLDFVLTNFNERCLNQSKQYYDHYTYYFKFGQSTEQSLEFLKQCMTGSSSEVYGYTQFTIGRSVFDPFKTTDYRFPVRINLIMRKLSVNAIHNSDGCIHLLFNKSHYTNKFKQINSQLK